MEVKRGCGHTALARGGLVTVGGCFSVPRTFCFGHVYSCSVRFLLWI